MLNDPLFYVIAASVLLVLVILMIGIGGFAKGGDFNRKHANRIMRYRVAAQAVAVLIALSAVTLLAVEVGQMPFIAVGLAFTFGLFKVIVATPAFAFNPTYFIRTSS